MLDSPTDSKAGKPFRHVCVYVLTFKYLNIYTDWNESQMTPTPHMILA
jgi:hypothetical protein